MEVTSENNTENSQNSGNNTVALRSTGFFWRPTCLINIVNDIIRRSNPVLDSIPTVKNNNKNNTVVPPEPPVVPASCEKLKRKGSTRSSKTKSKRNTLINIVLVEAKGLPDVPDDGLLHTIYCKFQLGSHTFKSKSAPTLRHTQWKERFKLNSSDDQLLHISLWDKGKQKNFMGRPEVTGEGMYSRQRRYGCTFTYNFYEKVQPHLLCRLCVLDLSTCEKERTQDIWQPLDEGYGSIHLAVTICTLRNEDVAPSPEPKVEDLRSKFAFYNVSTDPKLVGQLLVKVCGAKGLSGKPVAYCTLELDNESVQTPRMPSSAEPVWDKSYIFNIYDVTSTLEVKVYDSSINTLLNNFLGRVSIPLLRIMDGEARWYALKDSSRRRSAKGNCPRIRLEMSLVWNPVTASLKLFRPKQVKYIEKQPPKFDIPLVYKNVKFVRDTFDFLYRINESFKRLFEWDDREVAATAVTIWLAFWYFFEPWMGPLLIIALFPVVYIYDQEQRWEFSRSHTTEDVIEMENTEDLQNGESIANKVKGLPEMTLTITNGIEYLVSVAERLNNLATFKIPFLSYLTIVLLVVASVGLYCIPFKYLMMAFGLYKFLRKRLNPDRVLNNDLLDFISRIPDNKILKDWKELNVPEPYHLNRYSSLRRSTTPSTS